MFGSNYSIGVNIWFNVIKAAASGFNKAKGYEVSIDETHHVNKKTNPAEQQLLRLILFLKACRIIRVGRLTRKKTKYTLRLIENKTLRYALSVVFV